MAISLFATYYTVLNGNFIKPLPRSSFSQEPDARTNR